MKIKKLPNQWRIFVAMILAVIIPMMAFGMAEIFAEPTIYDLVEQPEIGKFKPNESYDNEPVHLVAWLNTNNLIFSYDWWTDTSGDGNIDVEDVYCVEGFEKEMSMHTMLYPIFETSDEKDNYYLVPLTDYASIEGVIVRMQIAENNDLAHMHDEKTYWFDHENNYLYIKKDLIKSAIEAECFNSIRMESIMLVKDMEEATKKVVVATVFSEDVKETYGLDKLVPNKEMDMNIYDWRTGGLEYQLIPVEKLASISKDDLNVFVNESEMTEWSYDETNGHITINCQPFTTRTVVVKINKVTESNSLQETLQMSQSNSNDRTAQAASIQDAVPGYNMFLHYLKYEETEPQIGDNQKLGFALYVYTEYKDNANTYAYDALYRKNDESPPVDIVVATVKDVIQTAQTQDGHYHSTTISAYQDGDIDIFGSADDNYDNSGRDFNVDRIYGDVLFNVFLASHTNNNSYITQAMNISQTWLFGSVTNGTDYSHAMSTTWNTWNRDDGDYGVIDGRYIVGTNHKTLLGGKLLDDSGKAFFDVTCARIEAPNAAQQNWNSGDNDIVYGSDTTDYKTNVTIVDIKKDATTGGGDMYVCVWSRSLAGQNQDYHTQRVLSFSKVKYYFNGKGHLQLTKRDEKTSQLLDGAVFGIYKYDDPNCRPESLITTITSSSAGPVKVELTQGDYWIKEITPPVGYLLRPDAEKITIEGGKVRDYDPTDERQKVKFTFTVIDKTTKGTGYEMPVPGIKFELYDPSGNYHSEYTTKSDGTISATVEALGDYSLKQIGTVNNYAMDTTKTSIDYCESIPIHCTPNQTGQNYEIVCPTHYENRQTVTLESHVQDEKMLSNSPANLGGTQGGFVSLVDSSYELTAKSDLFLGYYQGQKVEIKAGTVLSYSQLNDGADTFFSDSGEKNYNKSYLVEAQSETGKREEAHISADKIRVYFKGKWLTFPLPNGEYEWHLTNASPGYWNMNGVLRSDGTQKSRTNVSAPWLQENQTKFNVHYSSTPVLQERQACNLTLFVKSYSVHSELKTLPTVIENRTHAVLLPYGKEAAGVVGWRKYVNQNIFKDVTSNNTVVSTSSVESASVYINDEYLYTVRSEKMVPNAIYILSNATKVVDIESGFEIDEGQPLAWLITDETGAVRVTCLGSEARDIQDIVKNSNIKKLQSLIPIAGEDTVCYGSAIPNGTYKVNVYIPADDTLVELGLHEDMVNELEWHDGTDGTDTRNIDELEANVVVFVRDNPPPQGDNPIVAPDPTVNPHDPYDPDHPDDPTNDPDDSTDITLMPIEWIKKNTVNIAYRIVDSDNISGEGANAQLDVSDKLPTTFALYLPSEIEEDENYEYRYELSFYYQISADEYESEKQKALSSGMTEAEWEINKVFIQYAGGVYLKRFADTGLSGGDQLSSIITFNEKSNGFKNDSHQLIKPNESISGAIYNTTWINKKLAQQLDGTYRIFACVETTIIYKDKTLGDEIIVSQNARGYDDLTIKHRQLVKLD